MAAADTISAPWTPASSGPPPDANGSGSDTKNLDVGEISDVSHNMPIKNDYAKCEGDSASLIAIDYSSINRGIRSVIKKYKVSVIKKYSPLIYRNLKLMQSTTRDYLSFYAKL